MKKPLALLFLMALTALSAQAKSLVLLLSDGTEVYYLLAGDTDPKMTWTSDSLCVDGEAFSISGLTKFYISDTDDPAAIGTLTAEGGEVSLSGGIFSVKGQKAVSVFTIDGRAVEASAQSDGTATTLNTNALPAGTYVIRFGEQAVKYQKK